MLSIDKVLSCLKVKKKLTFKVDCVSISKMNKIMLGELKFKLKVL